MGVSVAALMSVKLCTAAVVIKGVRTTSRMDFNTAEDCRQIGCDLHQFQFKRTDICIIDRAKLEGGEADV